jgi:hypothetical protein
MRWLLCFLETYQIPLDTLSDFRIGLGRLAQRPSAGVTMTAMKALFAGKGK